MRFITPAPGGLPDAFSASDAESVVIVGHNPGHRFSCTIVITLADGTKLARELSGHFPTAAFAAFEVQAAISLRAAGPRLLAAWKPPRDKDDD